MTLAALTSLGSGVLAQPAQAPFTPEQGRLFLQDAANKAREKQRESARTFEEFKKTVAKEPFQGGNT